MNLIYQSVIKNKLKITLSLIIGLVIFFLFSHCALLGYGIGQAKGQLKIIWGSQPISIVLADNLIADEKREKLMSVQNMLDFAYKEGLTDNGNYHAFYDQKDQPILWNVSASLPFEFTPAEWSFPFLGSFSYKGFFDLAKAEEEANLWKLKNYDIRIRPVSAWSTLGWFKDPILSGMLNRSEGELADLIFHELTHGTVFIKNQLQLNENLASFLGEKIAIKYLIEKFGENSTELNQYLVDQQSDMQFRSHMLAGKDTLNQLYLSWKDIAIHDTLKISIKAHLITEIIEKLDTVILDTVVLKNYQTALLKNRPNNAYFISFQRYYDNLDELQQIFDIHNQSVPDFLCHVEKMGLKLN